MGEQERTEDMGEQERAEDMGEQEQETGAGAWAAQPQLNITMKIGGLELLDFTRNGFSSRK